MGSIYPILATYRSQMTENIYTSFCFLPCGVYLTCLLAIKGSDAKTPEPMSEILTALLLGVLILSSHNNVINDNINHSKYTLNISAPAFSHNFHRIY